MIPTPFTSYPTVTSSVALRGLRGAGLRVFCRRALVCFVNGIGISISMRMWAPVLIFSVLNFSCTSKILKYEKVEQLKKNAEFESIVKIDSMGEPPPDASFQNPPSVSANSPVVSSSSAAVSQVGASAKKSLPQSSKITKSKISGKVSNRIDSKKKNTNSKSALRGGSVAAETSATSSAAPARDGLDSSPPVPTVGIVSPAIKHLPDIEDPTGFDGRRPTPDPFRVGESVVHEVSYFKVKAGEFEMRVGPYKMVNGQKAYSFVMQLQSKGLFSNFYSVEDSAETLVDYNEFIPRIFSLHVKESGQLREGQSYFDHNILKATYWEKKYTEKNGNEDKKQEWEILPFSQNVFSAIYYLRTFRWELGKEYAFRIADDNENIMFRGKALRREKLITAVGEFNAIVMKPEVMVKGIFRPMGDIFFWLSDDNRKYILRMELNIKIGTVVSEVIRLVPGQP